MMNKVKVVILGKDYTLQTEESPNYVYGLARALNKSRARIDEVCDESKSYVDDAGRARIERDAALKEIEMLKSKVAQLENSLRLKKLKDSI